MNKRPLTTMLLCCGAFLGHDCAIVSAQSDERPGIDPSTFYRSTLAAAEKALRLDETREAKYWLGQSPPELRGWEWDFLGAQSDVSAQVAALGDREATGLDVASHGRLAAIAFSDGTVSILALPSLDKIRNITGHEGAVYSVKFSSDASRIVTVSRDVTSRVWDVSRGEELSRIRLDNPGVAAATFSPDDKQVATCTWLMTNEGGKREIHGVVWVWDADSGEVIHKRRVGVKPLDSIAWSGDGKRLAVGSWDGQVHLLSKDTEELDTIQVPDNGVYTAVIAVAISPNGRLMACGSKDRTARVWELESGRLVATLEGHQGFVTEVLFSPAGNELWTAGADGTIRQWDIEQAKQLRVLRGHDASVVGLAAIVPQGADAAGGSNRPGQTPDDEAGGSPSNFELCSVGLDGAIRRWAPAHDEVQRRLRLAHEGTYTTVWSPDGSRIYVACYDGTVQIVDAQSGSSLPGWTAHEGSSCNTLSLSADGRRLLTCSWDKTARLWDPADSRLWKELRLEAGCYDCSLSPDGRLAALAIGNRLEIWDLESGRRVSSYEGPPGGQLTEVCFSPDGKRVAAAGGEHPAVVWDVADQQVAGTLQHEGSTASTVSWSSAGEFLATSGGGRVDLWNARTLEFVRDYQVGDRAANQLAFSPDGRRLAVAADAITVIDPTREGTLLRLQPCDDDIYFMSFSPDGRQLACCTTGGLIAIASAKSSRADAPPQERGP